MINKEKLIEALEEICNRESLIDPDECDIKFSLYKIIDDIEKGRYDARCVDTHDVDDYYKDDEDVWCK